MKHKTAKVESKETVVFAEDIKTQLIGFIIITSAVKEVFRSVYSNLIS